MSLVDKCVSDVLIRGLDDWVQAAEVASVARDVGGAIGASEVLSVSLEVYRSLLIQELMAVGSVSSMGFCPWTHTVEESLRRIEREWKSLPDGPGIGDICWLEMKRKGRERASRMLNP